MKIKQLQTWGELSEQGGQVGVLRGAGGAVPTAPVLWEEWPEQTGCSAPLWTSSIRSGGWETGKWRIKHYLLILNICSLHIGELSLAKGETKSRWTAFLSDSYICWFFHWHPAFGVSIFLIRKQQRAVIAHVWIQHLTSMFSYREDHPLWACKASVSLRHGAETFICPQSGGLSHHRWYLSLSFLAPSISQSTAVADWTMA